MTEGDKKISYFCRCALSLAYYLSDFKWWRNICNRSTKERTLKNNSNRGKWFYSRKKWLLLWNSAEDESIFYFNLPYLRVLTF